MAVTDVSIVNMALLELGADTITALSDTDKQAVVANALWEQARDYVLTSHEWKCAIKRADLTLTEWDATTTFDATDIVEHEGNVYVCIQEATNKEPGEEALYWTLLYSRTPEFGWTYQVALPTDCLRVLEMNEQKEGTLSWVVEGGYLLTDDASPEIRYIYRNDTETSYDALLIECLSLYLASKMAYAIVGKESVSNNVLQKYHIKLNEARCKDAQASQNSPTGDDYLVTERY
jgi:hypothetical protein